MIALIFGSKYREVNSAARTCAGALVNLLCFLTDSVSIKLKSNFLTVFWHTLTSEQKDQLPRMMVP